MALSFFWPIAETSAQAERINHYGTMSAVLLTLFYVLGVGYAEMGHADFYTTHITSDHRNIAMQMSYMDGLATGVGSLGAAANLLSTPEGVVKTEWLIYAFTYLFFAFFNYIKSRVSQVMHLITVVWVFIDMAMNQSIANPAFGIYLIALGLAFHGARGSFEFHTLKVEERLKEKIKQEEEQAS